MSERAPERVYICPPAPIPMAHGCWSCGSAFEKHTGEALLCPSVQQPKSAVIEALPYVFGAAIGLAGEFAYGMGLFDWIGWP